MKFFAFIFSLYFIALALLPCQDNDDMIAIVTHATIQKSHSCDDQKSQENCPPFCTCSCCSTARYLTAKQMMPVFSKTVVRNYPELQVSSVQEQPINIWQPPQIS